jgi:hypothetical protein
MFALTDACQPLGRDQRQIRVSACFAGDASEVDEGQLQEYAAAGAENWVVPDAALGGDRSGWQASLACIRAETSSVAAM